jgi:hypothetical protein
VGGGEGSVNERGWEEAELRLSLEMQKRLRSLKSPVVGWQYTPQSSSNQHAAVRLPMP